ncbi:MAG: LacI family DNA-binding transcriptional regulator [Ilumatobacter sp.]
MIDATSSLTLEEIGRLAGVSRSTVSRVLNDHPNVRAEVRHRVGAVIAETGFVRNQAARALASKRTGLVGLVMPTGVDELFGDPYYSALVRGIQAGCERRSSILSIFPVDPDPGATEELVDAIARSVVDGVVVTAGRRSDALIASLRDRGRNVVVVGHPVDDRDVRRVDVDNAAGSAAAVQHLVDTGRRRIAFVGPQDPELYAIERLEGYRSVLERSGLGIDDRLIVQAAPSRAGAAQTVARLLEHRIDAVHAATDALASAVIAELGRGGRVVPDDVAVVGFDGFDNGDDAVVRLSTVVQPVEAVGSAAVRLLLDDDANDVGALRRVVMPTELRIGASSAPSAGS